MPSKFCSNCGKKSTKSRLIDDKTATCSECRSEIVSSNGMNDYIDSHASIMAEPPTVNDDETLTNITFGTLKSWLTLTYAQHVAEIDKRLTKEITDIKKDLEDTKGTLANTNTELQKLKSEFIEFKKSTNKSVSSLEQKTMGLEDDTKKQRLL